MLHGTALHHESKASTHLTPAPFPAPTREGGERTPPKRKGHPLHIETDITGEFHLVYKRKGQKEPHFTITGSPLEQLDKRKIREYLNGCDWSDRACPAWSPACKRPDDFMKDPPAHRPRR